MSSNGHTGGFTLVEMVTAIVVAALFINMFVGLITAMQASQMNIKRRDTASDIALSNLRKFTDSKTLPIAANCAGKMDLTAVQHDGLVLGDDTSSASFTPEDLSPLGPDAHQKILAFAPYGCSPTALNIHPIKIVSTVTFGQDNQEVVHVAYIN